MDQPGLSFSPFNQRPGQAAPGASQSPVQDAIKILSFRMPSVVGAGAPAPQSLLGGPTAQGTAAGGGLMQEFLKRLLMGQGAPAAPSAGTPMPTPMSGPVSPFSAGVPSGPSMPTAQDTSSPLPASVQFTPQPTGRIPDSQAGVPPLPPSGGGGFGGGGQRPY